MTVLSLLATKITDIDAVIQIREMNPDQRLSFLQRMHPAKVMRLSSMYWQFDYPDLLDMKAMLMKKFLKGADITDLLALSNPEK